MTGPFLLSWGDEDRTQVLVTERHPAHRVGVVDLAYDPPELVPLVGAGIAQPSQAVVCGDRLVVSGEGKVLSLDASRGLRPGVTFAVPNAPMFPGSWADVEVEVGLTGLTRADLTLTVEGDAVALDEHPPQDADPSRPAVRVLAGAVEGRAELVATYQAGGVEVGRTPILVGILPGEVRDGPSLWVDSQTHTASLQKLMSLQPGVGDAGGLAPQMLVRDPATGAVTSQTQTRWRVVVVLVDTGDATWPTTVTATNPAPTVATAQTYWRRVFTGATGINAYYREMSNQRMRVDLVGGSVLGPVHLGGKWSDWHVNDQGRWAPSPAATQKVVTALQGSAGVDWTQVDAVFWVMRSASATDFAWPYATIERAENVTVLDPKGKSTTRMLARVSFPHDTATVGGGGWDDIETACHELGHTFGLKDQYMDDVDTYTTGMRALDLDARELMSWQGGLPHTVARHKLLLGFLDPAHVRSFTHGFDAGEYLVDLVPASSGLPPANWFAAVELRLAPGKSWFFELRQPNAARLGDNATFPAGGEIVCYDALKYKDPPIVATARRGTILLVDDGDGEGVLLTVNEDYESVDDDDPANLQRFRLEVLSITPGAAQVRVIVGRVEQPDPVLINNAGRASNWKSPSIEVHNAVTDTLPEPWASMLANIPQVGVNNRVVAKVHNAGGLDAPNVSVRFKVLPFNTDDDSSTRWMELPAADGRANVVHDIPAGETVDFETEWNPQEERHWCLQARIDRYVNVPGALADEPDVDNNLAQSNYFQQFSRPASPATRQQSFVEVHNPYNRPVYATVELGQDSDLYRSFVDHRWVYLLSGETRRVRLEVESKATSIWEALEAHWPDGNTWLRAWLPNGDCTQGTGTGVGITTSTAVDVTPAVVEHGGGSYYLRLEGPQGTLPQSGAVAVLVDYEGGSSETVGAEVANGKVHVQMRQEYGRARLFFTGGDGFAPVMGWEFEIEP